MRRVILESPFAGDTTRHIAYARRCMIDSLTRGEAPFVAHLLYPMVLDDHDPHQRDQGFEAAAAWYEVADAVVVYTDYGVSPGMQLGVIRAALVGLRLEYRTLSAPEK